MDIEIEKPQSKFAEHLEHNSNSRIVLSGKFGTGKSYFLKKYFETHKESYNIFWLNPINYVVGANQDIFEWIKVDLARDLITQFLPAKKNDRLKKNFLIQSYIYNNASSIFAKLIETLSNDYLKVRTGIDFLDSFKKEIEEYKAFEKNANDSIKSESEYLNTFLNHSISIKGSIYEDDLTTQTIRAALEVVRLKNKKENLLIIDDLDRLDPEHIFRILNILSAHNDHFDSNKFGFDKVIVVCDLNNIENLYKHRYGKEADFDGYIEKFYTYEPFHFSINDAIINFCQDSFEISELSEATKNTLSILLVLLFKNKKLRIRNLKKIVTAKVNSTKKLNKLIQYKINATVPNKQLDIRRAFFNSYNFEIDYSKFDIINGLTLISIAFGGIDNFQKTLNDLDTKELSDEKFNEKFFPNILKSICILSHIAKESNHNERGIFFNWNRLNNDSDWWMVDAISPNVTFFGVQFNLSLRWSYDLHYINGDFFENAKPDATQKLNQLKQENILQKTCNLKNLVDEIKIIITFLLEKSMI